MNSSAATTIDRNGNSNNTAIKKTNNDVTTSTTNSDSNSHDDTIKLSNVTKSSSCLSGSSDYLVELEELDVRRDRNDVCVR